MRQRLIAAFIGLAVLVVALYAVPRAYYVSHLIHEQEQLRVDDTATLVAHVLDDRASAPSTSLLDGLNGDYEWIVVHRGGTTVTTTGAEHGGSADDLTSTQPLTDGTVTVGLSARVVASAVSDAIVPLVLLGLGIILLAGFAGYLIAARLSRPFQDLADAASGLGTGELRPTLPDYRVPELRAIAQALTSSGAQIETTIAHERKLAVHASHELRTPIAALRLELEDLALWRETPPSVAEQLQHATGELDRLALAVGDLLAFSTAHRAGAVSDVDLEVVVQDAVDAVDAGRGRIVQVRQGVLPARLDAPTLTRIVREILEAVLATGARRVTVTAVDRESHLEVRFVPEGRVRGPSLPRSTTDAAVALGGRVSRDGSVLILRLPQNQATVTS